MPSTNERFAPHASTHRSMQDRWLFAFVSELVSSAPEVQP
jgi:hypothetical protein